jgi:signal transduction histidine kinase
VEASQVDVPRELDRLRGEIERLRAARRRLVLAADDDRRTIERDLHDGVQQRLVALAVQLQLAERATYSDPDAVKALLEEMDRDVQEALDKTALLAQRTYPASLEADGLAALLRSAALNAGVPASVDVAADSDYPPEIRMTIYLCWLDTLARGSGRSRATISVRDDEGALAFEVVGSTDRSLADVDRMRDRVEALGGELTSVPASDGRVRVTGLLPLA